MPKKQCFSFNIVGVPFSSVSLCLLQRLGNCKSDQGHNDMLFLGSLIQYDSIWLTFKIRFVGSFWHDFPMKLPRNWLALCRNWPEQYRCGQLVSGHFNGRETMRSSRMLERLNNKYQRGHYAIIISLLLTKEPDWSINDGSRLQDNLAFHIKGIHSICKAVLFRFMKLQGLLLESPLTSLHVGSKLKPNVVFSCFSNLQTMFCGHSDAPRSYLLVKGTL